MNVQLLSTTDGTWLAVRRGREVALVAHAEVPYGESTLGPGVVARATLDDEEAELAFAGSALVAISGGTRIALYEPPTLELVARHELEAPGKLAAVTGGRLMLVGGDGKSLTLVRAAQRALAAHTLDAAGPLEFAVGLEKNQLLLAVLRKLEVWDAVAGRPVLRLQLQLPPPPRVVGAAQGHLWVTRPGSDEVLVYRMSDGRPFRHVVGAPVQDVICLPSSPVIALVTPRGLVRVHCFAHSVALIDAPYVQGDALALRAIGDEVMLLGIGGVGDEPWKVPLTGANAAISADEPPPAPAPAPEPTNIRARLGREPVSATATATATASAPAPAAAAPPAAPAAPAPAAAAAPAPAPAAASATAPGWRDALVAADGAPADGELLAIARLLSLTPPATAALTALYAAALTGEHGLSAARLATLAGWDEALLRGALAPLLERAGARLALRRPVRDALDGTAPRVRLLGTTTATRRGMFRVGRDGKSDAELEAQLAAQLGRIAIVERLDELDDAVLEARLHGAAAVAFGSPAHRPLPWPPDACLVLVLPGSPTSWLADLPTVS